MTLAPRGAWQEGVPLTWTAVRGADRYVLELDPPSPFPIGSLTGTAWKPSSEQRRQLPASFRWRVDVYAGGEYVGTSGWTETTR
jgi:hypothetical protein